MYKQIADQLRELIASGELPAGRRLPSVRTLAGDLGVNLNTVARAYRMLREEGFVEIGGRSGVKVCGPDAAGGRVEKGKLLKELRAVVARLRMTGLGKDELRRVVSEEIDSLI